MPQGFEAAVLERGAALSTGERQLLSFARALAFDPRILVLDEATSSVDGQTERLIQDGLVSLMKGRTSLVIAHRLSTIQHADRILVLHRGRAREEGTHEELVKQDGMYRKLYRLQFRPVDAPKAAFAGGEAGA
jgi:ATP-binding cassette subfamily B protein